MPTLTEPETFAFQLVEHGRVDCPAESPRASSGPFERVVLPDVVNEETWLWGGGILAGDLDQDGWLDLMLPTETGMDLLRGSEDGVAAVDDGTFAAFDLTFSTGGTVADYDGDGDLDVYVTRFTGFPAPEGGPEQGRNRLLRNDGDFVFTDVTDIAGVDGCGYDRHSDETRCFRSMSSSWADFDQDGDLDLFVGTYGYVDESEDPPDWAPAEPSFLYLNNGDGTFTDHSAVLPDELHDGYTFAGGFFDLDDDGDLDLYTVNDFGSHWPNRVLWNVDGALTYDPEDATGLVINTTGMGLGIGDLNGDGWLDLAIPAWGKNRLLESRAGLGIWFEVAQDVGFISDSNFEQHVGWGTLMGDIDNDGDLDILSPYGAIVTDNPAWRHPLEQPDGLYINRPDADGEPEFTDEAVLWGVADGTMGRGAVLADLNRDGFLDIGRRDLVGPTLCDMSRCDETSWTLIHLRQPGTMNTHAVGARVVIEAGDLTVLRHLHAGGTGYGTGEPPEIHVGLGENEWIDRLVVTWPDGEISVAYDIATRQQLTITR